MAWGIVRFLIFSLAFLFGLLANGSVNAGFPPTDQDAMKSVVVSCDKGRVIVTPTVNEGAIQLECTSIDIFVVPNKDAAPEKIPVPVQQLGPIAMTQHP